MKIIEIKNKIQEKINNAYTKSEIERYTKAKTMLEKIDDQLILKGICFQLERNHISFGRLILDLNRFDSKKELYRECGQQIDKFYFL